MFRKTKSETMTYGIIGLGRFGYALAQALAGSCAEILVLDSDEEKVREIRELTENAYVVRTLDKKSLAETGIHNCDVAIVCIGEQMDTSILTTLNLVSMGIPHVIAKANSVEHGEILTKLGAEVVYPEHDMAVRLANRLEASRVLDIIQLSEKINISKILVPNQVIGHTVREIDIRSRFKLNIIAIENNGNVLDAITPDYVFRKNDMLFLSGSKEGLQKLSLWLEQ